MELEIKLRQDFNTKIRPFFIGEKCEICESLEDLHLHHTVKFSKLMEETLDLFGLENKDTEDYNTDEIRNIRNMMLGKQMNIKYVTCCQGCHINIHSENSKNRGYNYKLLKEDKKRIKIYLKTLVGKKLYKEEQEELINAINYVVNSSQKRSYSSLNKFLEINKIKFVIIPKRSCSIRFWVVESIKNNFNIIQ